MQLTFGPTALPANLSAFKQEVRLCARIRDSMESQLGRGIRRRGLLAGATMLGWLVACGGKAQRTTSTPDHPPGKTEQPLQSEIFREIQIINASQRAVKIEQEFGGENLLDLPEAERNLYIRDVATVFTQVKTGGRLAPINLINATKVLPEEEFLKRIGQATDGGAPPVLIDSTSRTILINANSSTFTRQGILSNPTLRVSNPTGNPVRMLGISLVFAYEEIYQLFSFS